jgi:hypothetical protein
MIYFIPFLHPNIYDVYMIISKAPSLFCYLFIYLFHYLSLFLYLLKIYKILFKKKKNTKQKQPPFLKLEVSRFESEYTEYGVIYQRGVSLSPAHPTY